MASILLKIRTICNSPMQIQLSEKRRVFSEFFFLHLWNLHQIINISRKNMIVIANIFGKLQTVKDFVRPFCKKRRFGTRSYSENVKVCQVLAKSPWECFYHVFSSFWGKLIWKLFPLVLGKILEAFFKTLTADSKYPVQYCENLQLPIQMQLSVKRKTFSESFVPFLESRSNLKYLEIKDDAHS